MKQLPTCLKCHAPAPDTPIPTRMMLGCAVFYRCPGCNTEKIIPWGLVGVDLIERARNAGVTE